MFKFFKSFKKRKDDKVVVFQITRGGKVTFDTADADVVTKCIANCASTDETFFSVLMSAATWAVADNAPVTRRRILEQFKGAVAEQAKYLTKIQAQISLEQLKKSKEDEEAKNEKN